METILPIVLVGLGSAAMVILRGGWLVLGAFVVQWIGLILVVLLGGGASVDVLTVEAITALGCAAVLGLTLARLSGPSPQPALGTRSERMARRREQGLSSLPASTDDLWPVVVVLAGAIAGLVLARLYPLGGAEGTMVAFYWVVLSGVLVMVLEGARDPVKTAAGLLALLNGVALLLNTQLGGAPEPVTVGLMSVSRIALAAVLAYGWVLLHALFSTLSLAPLFTARNPEPPEETRTEC